ncbi:MAG: ATP-binding protein [Vulcanimicrobiota bacterium]
MKLLSIEYCEYKNEPKEWKLEKLMLDDINLIVGRNASGKTRVINIINGLGDLISRTMKSLFQNAYYRAEFDNNGIDIVYELELLNKKVTKELLLINKQERLKRNSDGTGNIFNQQINRDLDFKVQDNEIAVFSKRDSIQHPFLDDLYKWGSELRIYRFGGSMGQKTLCMQKSEEVELNLKSDSLAVTLFDRGISKFGDEFKQAVIADLVNLDYNLDDIEVNTPLAIKFDEPFFNSALCLVVKENDIQCNTEQISLSQGMFRALSLIIQLNFSQMADVPSCILIDDIGEGLDYDRSTSLIKLIIAKMKNLKTQLVMTSNDRFVMNNVPLEYWSIINRKGGNCKAINYKNSKKVFDEFEFTGLNNFDFFSSKYFTRNNN